MPRFPDPTKGSALDRDYAKYGFPLWTERRWVPRVLVPDPWEYIDYHLGEILGKTTARRPRAFLEQARDFFAAAEGQRTSSRPLLYYYAFLNLVKVLLLAKSVALSTELRHGLRRVPSARAGGRRFVAQKVQVVSRSSGKDVFPRLVSLLGGSVADGQDIRVNELLQQCVGIHTTWAEVNSEKSCFARAHMQPMVRFDRKAVFARVILERPWDNPNLPHTIGRRAGWIQTGMPKGSKFASAICLETCPVTRKGVGYRSALTAVADSIRRLGVHALLTRDGYRMYLSDFGQAETARLPQLASVFAGMFYFGDVTRYQPQDFDTIVGGEWGWLVNDFLNTQPRQFLYLLASELTCSEVVIPFGHLD